MSFTGLKDLAIAINVLTGVYGDRVVRVGAHAGEQLAPIVEIMGENKRPAIVAAGDACEGMLHKGPV